MICDICGKEKDVLVECPFMILFCLECYDNAMCDWDEEDMTCTLSCGAIIEYKKEE